MDLGLTKPGLDIPAPIPDELKQRLRLRRFLLASAFSVLYLAVLAVVLHTGQGRSRHAPRGASDRRRDHSRFFWPLPVGLNLRFADPSLTEWQLMAAVCTMLYVVYRAPDTRLAFTAFFFVALMFGMLRHSDTKLAVLGSVSVASFALVTGLRYAHNHEAEMLRLDMLQLLVMATTFPWFVLIGGRVKRLQRDLTAASIKLEDIEEQARRDDLTGVYNRRALIAAMEESKRRADAVGEPLSICVIDLDLFKRYNDEFDHLTGDHVLRTFAQFAQAGLRTTDVFGRYGGEEFVQILQNTTLAGARADAERLRERVSAHDIPSSRSIGRLTVSIGVAQYERGESIMGTFARADEAMYKAKQRGRNRVECWGSDAPPA